MNESWEARRLGRLEDWQPATEDISRMRRIARKKAATLARGHDDIDAAAQDIEQDGWEAFLISRLRGKEEWQCWLVARGRMAERYFKFRFGSRHWARYMPLQGVDLTPLASLDPSVEDLVFGCELMRHFEAEFDRRLARGGARKYDKCAQVFEMMILNGSPGLPRDLSKSAGINPQNQYRKRRIREIYKAIGSA